VLCIGDDTTDEDMFNFLNGKGITIKIGNAATAANYNVATQAEVLPLLSRIMNTSNTKEQNACT